ncbi:MAG: PQQ-binding-like beta-propeller repeat protein [Phycisphaerae bacterium]
MLKRFGQHGRGGFAAGVIPVIAAGVAVALLAFWLLGSEAAVDLRRREPGLDRPPAGETPSAPSLPGTLESFDVPPGAAAESDWPQFRGPGRDGVAPSAVELARDWPQDGPPVLWQLDLGEGYAAAATHGGRAYVLDYDRQQKADVLRCLNLDTGREIYRRSVPVEVLRNHGMSRTIPAVTEDFIVTIGPKCHVMCLDADTGEYIWGIDMPERYGTKVPPWYAGQCPLIEDGRVILAPAGDDVLLTAIDAESGEVLWQTPNRLGWNMTHSSVMPMEVAGTRMYVYCGSGGVVGVSADDGTVLWQTDAWKISIATVPSPVICPDDRILLTGGYNAGSMMARIRKRGDDFEFIEQWRLSASVFGAEQQTPILYEEHIYGVRADGRLVCLDLDGNVLWTSGKQDRFGLGGYLLADGMLYVMNDEGVLTLVEASPRQYRRLARAQVLPGHECWGPPALAGGKLLVRDLNEMRCLDVSAEMESSVASDR